MLDFNATVSVLIVSLINERFSEFHTDNEPKIHSITAFVIRQYQQMPDYARTVIWFLCLFLDALPLVLYLKPFHSLDHKRRWRYMLWLKHARWALLRDMIRFYEVLVIFAWYANYEVSASYDCSSLEHTF